MLIRYIYIYIILYYLVVAVGRLESSRTPYLLIYSSAVEGWRRLDTARISFHKCSRVSSRQQPQLE
jgi:hypothetical protein